MFKKLASLLFEEEEIPEEEEEKVDLKRVKKQPEPIKAEVRVPVIEEPAEKPRKRSFDDIIVDEPAPKSPETFRSAPIDEKKEPVRPSEPAFIDRRPCLLYTSRRG